ncbi:MAG: LysR family transcriptional regulator [Jhaorihella sp.]
MSDIKPSYLPPLKALRAFEAAARRGGFALGAEEIGITPSAVSHQIRNLERDLDIALFDRHAGRAKLTPAGAAYFGVITEAFGAIAEATRGIKPSKHKGRLIVASGPSFAARWLQPRLPLFLSLHPNVTLQVVTFSNVVDLEHLEFDLAISYRKPLSDILDAEPLLTEELQPLCSPELSRNLAIKEINDLQKATLIHSDNALGGLAPVSPDTQAVAI